MSSAADTKVLVADDDELVRRTMERTLRRRHEVLMATDGLDALKLLRQHPDVAVIFSDFDMPGLNGVELLRDSLSVAPKAVRILTSGAAELDSFRDVVDECRLYTFLPKPLEPQAVRVVVQRAAEHHLLQLDNEALVAELERRAASEEALRRAFQQYVPIEVVNELVEGGGPASLVGIERDVTVLLADLRGFTGFSEKRPPIEVVGVLNQFFTAMAGPILRYGGTIDKYIGDSVLAHFGGRRPQPDAPNHAVLAALEMREALVELNERMQGIYPPLAFGVAINTGPCIIGNVGCAARMDYTIIGDTVNLTSRLEELTKQKPNSILLTEATKRRLSLDVAVEAWPTLSVRGREKPVLVYELVGPEDLR
ncbi:MAG: adenylate/guanylate cyclase domain-containing protein [Polyangiaceae bacterium]